MKFTELDIEGVYIIELEKAEDYRGFFARAWDLEIFEKKGLGSKFVQSNISFNKKKGTTRGIHYQLEPYQEDKFVRCVKGKAFQVTVDLRKNSKTYLKWTSAILTPKNYKMLYCPKGVALGLQTQEDETEIFYQVTNEYKPEYEGLIRWNDSLFNIKWPLTPTVMSEKDRNAPDYVVD